MISLSSLLAVFILFKLVYRDDPNFNELYGSEIILFHSDERYKKRVWRFNLLEDVKSNNLTRSDKLELQVMVGEFSENTQEIVKHAVNHNFNSITIIAGPKVFCEDRTEIYTLLDKYQNIEYFILPERPTKHFMIFNNTHLYVEKPHRHTESRGSVGIKKCNPEVIKTYKQTFSEILAYAKPLTKEEVLNQQCYKEGF
jgi:hypothetical protein